jgi:hypothetical protein
MLLVAAHHQARSVSVMTTAAKAFLASLEEGQKGKATFKFNDEERLFWHFIPTDDIPKRYNKPRMGLILAEMTPHQKHLATAMLAAGLSQSGMIKAVSVMSLEDVLRILEKDTIGRRNPEKYHFSVFGEPSDTGTWSYRIEGHHLSLHFTVVSGKLAGSPTFFGANPHEIRQGPRSGLRVLAQEEDLARALVQSLTPEQQKTAIVDKEAYRDILTEASRKAALKGQPNGISVSKLNAKQREMLNDLVGVYISNVTPEIAAARQAQLKAAGNNIYFAWAGGINKGDPHYYRVAAPAFLIEYDNTQNGANHSHTVWRDYEGDFGLDLLGEHYQTSHKK